MKIYKPIITLTLAAFAMSPCAASAQASEANGPATRQSYQIYVDKDGVMRRNDTNAEVSYYGTNYTLPFAHAYRAMGYLGVDRKAAIDRDVYHMARLGFNAFRLHLWDAELADENGNLLSNDHLDLLDYLIAQLEKRGIDIVLTAQTNFGNGYPEKNIDTGAFTYDFDKCDIHDNPKAQKIQANYLSQLAAHRNPYTGLSYSDDNAIIAMEINNEPCHSGSKKVVTDYINKMVKALKKGGFKKPILYNVSHNLQVTEAYYDADIQGTTYQWYPIGLVASHQRKGNFLPFVDHYNIPWAETIPNFGKMARLVYEFDPGDILYSYMYPAITRTFRKAGFQWITQFAYDPTDMARFNTEYQTHFLNLAYTPAKAISMMIAAQAAKEVGRGDDYGSYPANTRFGNFTVDADLDLSVLSSPEKFYYSRSTSQEPTNPQTLKSIAGTGSSPLVTYSGTGAYFLDRLDDSHWRLEVMPDILLTTDPFTKPNLNREVGEIVYNHRPITLQLPGLNADFSYTAVNSGNTESGRAEAGSFSVYPGVYILSNNASEDARQWASVRFGAAHEATPTGNMTVSEFVAPKASQPTLPKVVHTPQPVALKGDTITISAQVVYSQPVDSVVIYPAEVSFWNDHNTLYKMQRDTDTPFTWSAKIPSADWQTNLQYNIVAFAADKAVTYPEGLQGTPLDWDAPDSPKLYSTHLLTPSQPIVLLSVADADPNTEAGSIPDNQGAWLRKSLEAPLGSDSWQLSFTPSQEESIALIRSYIEPKIAAAASASLLSGKETLSIMVDNAEGIGNLQVGFVGRNGVTYLCEVTPEAGTANVPLSSLVPAVTDLVPAAYPVFMTRQWDGRSSAPKFNLADAQYVVVRCADLKPGTPVDLKVRAIYIK